MIRDRRMMVVLLGLAFGAFSAGAVAHAQEATPPPEPAFEVCPVGAGDMGSVAPDVRSFDVEAPTARTARGNLAIDTAQGWYRVPFGPVTLAPAVRNYVDGTGYRITDDNFRSPLLYVKFNRPVTILNWWVEHAAADTSDWSSQGLFTCYPPPRPDPQSKYNFTLIDSDSKNYVSVNPRAGFIKALPVAPIERTDCKTPFADATVDKEAAPVYPFDSAMPSATATIAVLIMADGHAGHASVFKSSGITAFDIAAHDAAMLATYKPKIAYCRPTIGTYLYKVTYEPK